VATARSLFGVVMNSVRTPGAVELESCRSSSIMFGNRPATAEATMPMSLAFGGELGPPNVYVKVGSSPVP
jgi:hypothetical protein